jgi:fermentation-respiration switch protein FrsA (DUF1100 family)
MLLPNIALAQTVIETVVCGETVTVQPGETLSVIAGRTLGNQQAYAQIVTATNAAAAINPTYARIDNPDLIAAGAKLCIPGDTATGQPSSPDNAGGPATSTAETAATNNAADNTADNSAANSDGRPTLEEQWAKRMGPGDPHPLTIKYLREQTYPGSPIAIEQTLGAGSNYNRYLVSYLSEGLRIDAYMTVPFGPKPATGWPVIIFNHGYIPPEVYRPTERYIAYQDIFAANGYIVFRPDYRGHADSEGDATGAYSDPGYTIDVLNAISSVKAYADADPNRLGLWGHSMGGYITARVMVVRDDIKAGVIWAGVVGSYPNLIQSWTRSHPAPSSIPPQSRRWREVLTKDYGTPEDNPEFWASISANSYLADLSGPVQLHHGTADEEVPLLFSQLYYQEILAAGKPAEFYTYPGDNHNLSNNLNTALQRSLAFFDKYVKNAAPAASEE